MNHKLLTKMITLITLSYICPHISAEGISPTPSPSKPCPFDVLNDLMCAHYDPKATMESVKSDPKKKELCDQTDKPNECLEFLGNAPNASHVYAIEADVKTVRMFVNEAAEGAARDPPAEVKNSFDTCARSYNQFGERLIDVNMACEICTQQNGKCPPEEATKIMTALTSALADLGLCAKALDTTNATIKRWLVDVNLGATASISRILEVAKKLN